MKPHSVLSLAWFALALGLLITPPSLHAQSAAGHRSPAPPAANERPQRNFAVCMLFAPKIPELYFRDANRNYQRLRIDTISFDTWNVIPANSTVEVFQKTETPEVRKTDPVTQKEVVVTPAKTTYTIAKTWTIPPGTSDIRKLFYYDSNGKMLEYNFATAAETHDVFQARVINLLTQPVAIRFDTTQKILAPSADITLKVATAPEVPFIFQYGISPPDAPPFVAPTKKLRFHSPKQRLTIIIGYCPFEEFDVSGKHVIGTNYILDAIRFFEDVDKLPKPPPVQ